MDREDGPGVASDRSGARSQAHTQPLVGRTRERDFLRDELATARGGRGRMCLIGGEAGIGKTSLARDLSRAATGLGMRVLTGSCYDLTSAPPYGPWLDLFEACQRDSLLPDPPAALAGGHLAPVDDLAVLSTDVRRFLAAVANHQPTLVILEDLHWADPASLDLLRHIGPHLRHWPMLLLITYRAEELVLGCSLTHHLPALVREAEASRIDLRPLDAGALRALITSRYRLPPDDVVRLVDYLDRHADGNPLFGTEILRTLEEEALLRRAGDCWSLGSLDQAVVPSLLRQVIEERVIRLGDGMRRPLAIASVIGQEVPLSLWAGVADLDEDVLLDIVERAVRAHLLEAEPDGTRVRFVHALTRESLYQSIFPPRRRAWHLRVAESLLATSRPDAELVALHLLAAQDPRAARWLIAAGERAQRAYAWLTASERFRTAATLLEGVAGQEQLHRRLVMRVAYLRRFAYPADSFSLLGQAERLATQAGDALTVGEIKFQRGVLQCYSDSFRAGITGLRQAYAVLEGVDATMERSSDTIAAWLRDAVSVNVAGASAEDAAVFARMRETRVDIRRFVLGWYLAAAGQLDEAIAETNAYIAVYGDLPGERRGIRLLTAFSHHGLATAAAASGEPDAARRHWDRARMDFDTLDHLTLVAFTLLDELRDVVLPYETANPTRRRELAVDAEAALARASSTLRPGVTPSLARLRCLVVDGRWSEAIDILGDIQPPGNAFLRRETTFTRAFLARHRGEPDRAWAELLPHLPHGPASEPGDIIHQEGLALLRIAAGLCLDAGDPPTAAAWLEAHDRWLAWSGSVLGRADGQLAWGQQRLAAGNIDQSRARLDNALALASDPDQPMVRLVAHRLLGEIALRQRHLADARAHLDAAMALADACEVPFARALTLLAMGELQEATGAVGEATAHIEEARGIGEQLGAVAVLQRADTLAARAPTLSARFGLTAREIEVLRLVARQRTDKEIAETLFISPHTASTHVKHVLGKIGVASRRDAAEVAVAAGIV